MALYSWGANSHGQLGLGFETELCMQPRKVPKTSFNPSSLRTIKGGGGHVLVLDNNGQVHSCGWNNRGQLGVNCTDDKNEFICIPKEFFNNAPVDYVACGWDVSGAITTDKDLYLWGSNSFQQLGICKRGFSIVTQPLRLNLPRNEIPKQIDFGLYHCCILTEDNSVYLLGKLKITEQHPDIKISTVFVNSIEIIKIQCEYPIDSIACGQKHLLLVLSKGTRVIGLGDNKFGQSNVFEFTDPVKYATAGWTHNGILNETGIFLWGRNSYGQIGTLSKESIPYPLKLDLGDNVPLQLHLGSEHGLVVTKSKKVFTWGWNEHGNCGDGSTENVHFPVLVDLPAPCEVAGTGAGFCFAVCEDQ